MTQRSNLFLSVFNNKTTFHLRFLFIPYRLNLLNNYCLFGHFLFYTNSWAITLPKRERNTEKLHFVAARYTHTRGTQREEGRGGRNNSRARWRILRWLSRPVSDRLAPQWRQLHAVGNEKPDEVPGLSGQTYRGDGQRTGTHPVYQQCQEHTTTA